jgi:hypothetical protein
MMVSQGRCSGLAWTFNGVPFLDVPTFMRNEILQEPYCIRLSGTVAPCIIPQIDKAWASTVRKYLAQKASACPVPPPPLPSGVSRVWIGTLSSSASLYLRLILTETQACGHRFGTKPRNWFSSYDSRPSFFRLRPLLYLALHMDQQLRSVDNKQLLPARGLRHLVAQMPVVYSLSLSRARDVTSSVELAD